MDEERGTVKSKDLPRVTQQKKNSGPGFKTEVFQTLNSRPSVEEWSSKMKHTVKQQQLQGKEK